MMDDDGGHKDSRNAHCGCRMDHQRGRSSWCADMYQYIDLHWDEISGIKWGEGAQFIGDGSTAQACTWMDDHGVAQTWITQWGGRLVDDMSVGDKINIVQTHRCGDLSLQIFILLTLSFNTAIKSLSTSTGFGVPRNWVSHLNLHGGVDSGDLKLERRFSKRAVGVGAAALEGCIEFMQGL